ncbi:MAG: ATPase [Sphingomonadaceae bacterium]|nr:ATPase [Sphingomonadaceae bacterium]
MNLFLGVDAGGTSSKSRLTDENGNVLGSGTAGPANTRIGLDILHSTLLDVSMQAIQAAGLGMEDAAKVRCGMGIAGINRMGMKPEIQALDFPFANVQFTSDAMIANLGAHMGGDGAILIIGTGSVGLVKRGEDSFSIGGYGFPISDEGSGAALGLSAIRHALRALDGRTRPSPLSQAVTKQFDHAIPRVIAWMDDAAPGDYASFAPLVMDYADNGDEIALSIVRDAAQHVERFIETIISRGAPRCVLMGGLAERMKPWLRVRIVAQLQDALGDALDGALILAGRPIGSGAFRR